MHSLDNYIRNIIAGEVSVEERRWHLKINELAAQLKSEKYSRYIPALFTQINISQGLHPYSSEIYSILEAMLPEVISEDQAHMAFLPLSNESFTQRSKHFDFLDNLNFPSNTDITLLKNMLGNLWEDSYKYRALTLITRIKKTDHESYLIELLRENAGHSGGSNGYPPGYEFVYQALGELGNSLSAIPSLMAHRQSNLRYQGDIDRAVYLICKKERLPIELSMQITDPRFWQFKWNGSHTEFAGFVMIYSTTLYSGSDQSDMEIIATNMDSVAVALANAVNLNLYPYASAPELMADMLKRTGWDKVNPFTYPKESQEFAISLITGTGIPLTVGSSDETVIGLMLREYFATRLREHFNTGRGEPHHQ